MDFFEVVAQRVSVRSYDPSRRVPDNVLRRILEAGRLAPSAANRQPWRFFVISSEAQLARVHACYERPWFNDAPHVLAVVGRFDRAWTRREDGYNSLETDLAIALDHLILAATALGVGTCWIAAFKPAMLRDALELGPDDRVFAMTPLGYPRPEFVAGAKDRRALDEVVEQR